MMCCRTSNLVPFAVTVVISLVAPKRNLAHGLILPVFALLVTLRNAAAQFRVTIVPTVNIWGVEMCSDKQ